MSAVGQSTKFSTFFLPVLAWLVALVFFFPIFWMVLTSFKTAVSYTHLTLPTKA